MARLRKLRPCSVRLERRFSCDLAAGTADSFGCTATYGMLAQEAAREMGIPKMSAQAVGGAMKRNPIAIFIPCHRVVGANGKLGGYFGNDRRKIDLLTLEGQDMRGFRF